MCINIGDKIMIRTNVVLDEKIVKKALKISKLKTKRELIDFALRELIRHEDQHKLLNLRGKITWEGDLQSSREGR